MRFRILGLLLVLASFIPAQEVAENRNSIRNIRTAVNDGVVLLSWVSDGFLPTQVLRSTVPISYATINKARVVGTVVARHNLFTDVVEAPGEYFYAVVPLNADILASSHVEPYRNATVTSTKVGEVSAEVSASAFVRNLHARGSQKAVQLVFSSSKPGRQLAIFRGVAPFLSGSDLEAALHVATIDSALDSYIDSPPAVGSYYYGIYDTSLIEKDRTFIITGENTLAEPVFSMRDIIANRAEDMRIPEFDSIPDFIEIANNNVASLPEFQMKDIPIYLEPEYVDTLTEETENLIRRIDSLEDQLLSYMPSPILLEEDISNESLASALEAFRIGNYTEAVIRLEQLIENNTPIRESEKVLAYFYLGQSYYWTNSDNNALMYLIRAQANNRLYIYTEQYINAILIANSASS